MTDRIEQNTENSAPEGLNAGQRIFDGVYDQIRKAALGKTPEDKGQRFVEEIAQKAQMHIGDIQSRNLTNKDVYQEIWSKMDAYIMRYDKDPRFEEKKKDVSTVYSKLTGHVNKLVKNGDVDSLTAKVFVRYLDRYKSIGEDHYNAVVRNNQELPDGLLQQKAPEYARTVERVADDYGEDAELQESGDFVHFNADKQKGKVATRIYINPDLTQSPAQVLDAWYKSLVQTGLKDKIYFKVPGGLSKRQDGIVIYLTDQTNPSDVEKLLTTFLATCSPELLSPVSMPSAITITRGIAIAPELRNINTFLKYSGVDERISYNEWIASSAQLAFELAYNDIAASGTANITPIMLKDSARKYFEKIIKLSGLNPETMVPNALGGKLPSWARYFSLM